MCKEDRLILFLAAVMLVAGVFGLITGTGCVEAQPLEAQRPRRDPAYCEAACSNLKALGCEEGKDLVFGGARHTCAADCLETQNNGHAMNAKCISRVTSCNQVHTVCGE